MSFGTRSRIALTAVLLSGGALLAPAAPATAGTGLCDVDNCDIVSRYFSDASYTVVVGVFEDGPCGYRNSGVQTEYVKTFKRIC